MKNTTVEEIEAIMKEAEDVEINVRDSECVFVPKTWLYSKLTTLTQHHQDELREVYREILDKAPGFSINGGEKQLDVPTLEYVARIEALAQTRRIDISDKN